MRTRTGLGAIALALSASGTIAAPAPLPSPKVIVRIDLSNPFHLPPGASFTATQGPSIEDPIVGGEAPGQIHLCVQTKNAGDCSPNLDNALDEGPESRLYFSQIRYLDAAEIVHPYGRAAPPLIHLQLSSLHSGNGNQIRSAIVLGYRRSTNRFEVIFHKQFGRNNNEEVRYVPSGPLKGSMVLVYDAYDAHDKYWGYWLEVSRLSADYRYKQVLRYRSATRYGDDNRLAVIDSEMPNILRRLGLWRAGQPLPLPASHCPHPHLVKTELWCSAP